MPSLPIKFGQAQDSGVEEMTGAAPLSANVLADAGNAVRIRPGVANWPDFPAPSAASEVVDMAVFGDYLVYVTADRKLHAWKGPGLVVELSDATAATQLDGDKRPTHAVTSERVTFAGGGALQTWTGIGLSARLSGATSHATHVAAIASRLVINPRGSDGTVEWSDPFSPGHLLWPGNLQVLDARPDPVVAVWENTNELLGIGSMTLSFLAPDATAGFVIARVVNTGTLSPYAFCEDDEMVRFLDQKKRIVECDGRTVKPISTPSLTKTLRELAAVNDAWAFHANIGAYNVAVFVFPSEGRTFVYNVDAKTWSEWRGRSATGWTAFLATSYCYFPAHDLHLVGTSTGYIRQLALSANDDLGASLVADMVSGFQDRGSGRLKMCEAIKLVFRHTPGTTPLVSLSWRDDTGAYGSPIDLDITTSGTVEIRSLGTYRQREWRLTWSDAVPLSLISATEDYVQLEI